MKIHTSIRSLDVVREFVSVNARKHSFSEKQINDIRLAVDEACTNVIKHAYNYDEKGQLLIQHSFHPNSLTITITDQGRGFNFNSYNKPRLKDRTKKK